MHSAQYVQFLPRSAPSSEEAVKISLKRLTAGTNCRSLRSTSITSLQAAVSARLEIKHTLKKKQSIRIGCGAPEKGGATLIPLNRLETFSLAPSIIQSRLNIAHCRAFGGAKQALHIYLLNTSYRCSRLSWLKYSRTVYCYTVRYFRRVKIKVLYSIALENAPKSFVCTTPRAHPSPPESPPPPPPHHLPRAGRMYKCRLCITPL